MDFRRFITLRYAVAVALIAALSTGAWLTMIHLEKQHAVTAEVVNVSGRQRMLSQRIVLLTGWRMETPPGMTVAAVDAALNDAISEFVTAHVALTHGDAYLGVPADFSPEAHAIYFDPDDPLDAQVEAFVIAARAAATDPAAAAYIVGEAAGPLLDRLDQAVNAFEATGLQRATFMQQVHTAVWVAALLVLLLEVIFIFRPLARDVALSAARERDDMAKRRRLFAQIAHDLRTPIGVISGYAEALRDGVFGPIEREDQRRCIDGIANSAEYQLSMAQNLAALAKVNAVAGDELSNDLIDVMSLLRNCVGMLEDEAREAGVNLSVLDSEPSIVSGDTLLLRRVVVNLLTNAIRYGENQVLVAATSSEKGGLDIV
ncbi:MAG: histidine kinase dimerization/phospho-acceptor domain-containing protein, partial [Pseudomonadota bacterium]